MKRIITLVTSNKAKHLADLLILISTAYFVSRRIVGHGISKLLEEYSVDEALINFYVRVALGIVIFAFALKAINYVVELIGKQTHSNIRPDNITECLLRSNEEINRQLTKLLNTPKVYDPTMFPDAHSFEINLGLIINALASHIVSSIDENIKKRDVFISIYKANEFAQLPDYISQLDYMMHVPPNRNLIDSVEIHRDSSTHKNYLCWSCIDSSSVVVTELKWSKKNAKSKNRRYKKLKHYIGLKIACAGIPVAFLNIEFHSQKVFADQSDLDDYIESDLIPYHALIEYQFLKNIFFNKVSVLCSECKSTYSQSSGAPS